MNKSPGLRSTVVIAFALCLFLGMMLTPPSGDSPAELLQSLREHSAEAYWTGLFRFLTSLLVVPVLLAIAPSIRHRGSVPFRVAAVSLYVGSLCGVVVFTLMVMQNAVLAPMPNQESALAVAEALESSLLLLIPSIVYLVGLLIGFLLLGVSLWLAGIGRLVATAVSIGLAVHIAGGDWIVTSLSGALILSGGITMVGLRLVRGGDRRQRTQPVADPVRHLVSDEPR